jgi:hypothetical protein
MVKTVLLGLQDIVGYKGQASNLLKIIKSLGISKKTKNQRFIIQSLGFPSGCADV